MPEILRLDPNLYSLRHIRVGNSANGTGNAPALANASPVTLFGKSTSFEQLPISDLIDSPDVVSGTSTARLGDAGTWQIQFPNKPASDGVLWRERFCNSGRVDWIEIRRASGALEFVGCVETATPDYQSVTIAGHDAIWCLKSQYERDWQCLQSPRDVMNHASEVAVPLLVDSFLEATLNSSLWSVTVVGSGSYAINASSGLTLDVTAVNSSVTVYSDASFQWFQTRFTLACTINAPTLALGAPISIGTTNLNGWFLTIFGSAGAPSATLGGPSGWTTAVSLPSITGALNIVVESDGRWIRGFVNGQLVGYMEGFTSSLSSTLNISGDTNGIVGSLSLSITNFVFETWQSFLMVGSDQGDYVLPGTAQTFPTGGLHARYYNDLGVAGLSTSTYLATVLSPSKDNPASGTPAPYDVIETSPASTSPAAHVTSGFAATNWSAKYFGAIWLPLALGNVPMAIDTNSGGTAVRVWIGKTQFGAQLVDQWTLAGGSTYPFTVTAANYANGAGVVESGWYPIVLEFACNAATLGPALYFGQTTLPFGWTDPGGTVFTSGEAALVVPSTSLSPLGCVDQRYQGVSYFDMYQQTGQAYGYEFTCEPKSLESGSFPGLLVPRIREGHDTDEVLQADTSDGVSPVINYKNESDATDQCSSMYAIGAGINDGQGSQLQAQVFALANMEANLFDLQGWIDASDVSYAALLAQRAASQLALQEQPWQNLTGDPRGTDRLADTFPVSGVLSEFHWRPGDGVRFYLPDVNVEDTEPRQITQVTRTWGPTGRTASTMQSAITENALLQRAS